MASSIASAVNMCDITVLHVMSYILQVISNGKEEHSKYRMI